MGVVEDLAQAREAYERRDWVAAYDALSTADPGHLDGDDYERLAFAAALLGRHYERRASPPGRPGRHNDCVQALQRAYQLHLDAGDALAAAMSAYWLAMTLVN